jgi:signal transduction histidine kinase
MQRAGDGLRETIQRRDTAMRVLAGAGLAAAAWQAIEEVLSRERRIQADPVALSAAETAIETWLEGQSVARAWELAPACAEAGITVQDLEAMAVRVPASALSDALTWVAATLVFRESTEIIAECCHRIADLVEAIKGYSHMDRASVYDADIHEGIENTLMILAHRLRNVDVQRRYDRSIPMVRMYGNSLNQVWTNILDNAIDAIDEAGRIVIRTMARDDDVVIAIEDDGSGIPADALPRIFEPFFTLKPQGQGNGLGLDVAWRIVTGEYGGSVEATSEPGRTVFQVSLPLTPLAVSVGADQSPTSGPAA